MSKTNGNYNYLILLQANATLVAGILILITFQSSEIETISELHLKQDLLKNQINQMNELLKTTPNDNSQILNAINEKNIELIIVETNIQTLEKYPSIGYAQFYVNPSLFGSLLIFPFLVSILFSILLQKMKSEISFLIGIIIVMAFLITTMFGIS